MLAARFEGARPRLGAVQEAWVRLNRDGAGGGEDIANLDAWLTTVVARICLNMLRARGRENVVAQVPDPCGVNGSPRSTWAANAVRAGSWSPN